MTLMGVTALLVFATILHDDVGLANHFLGKSLCNIGGYVAFELGATRIIGTRSNQYCGRLILITVCLFRREWV